MVLTLVFVSLYKFVFKLIQLIQLHLYNFIFTYPYLHYQRTFPQAKIFGQKFSTRKNFSTRKGFSLIRDVFHNHGSFPQANFFFLNHGNFTQTKILLYIHTILKISDKNIFPLMSGGNKRPYVLTQIISF